MITNCSGYCYWKAVVDDNEIVRHEKGCIGAHIVRHMCALDHRTDDLIVECCNTTLCNRDMDSFLKRVEKEINDGIIQPPREFVPYFVGGIGCKTQSVFLSFVI
jgi:hypothetical protein